MLAEERFGQILNLLSKQRTATVQELCEALGTSESTIRRDLTELDRLGKLNKVHGGATLPDSRFLDLFAGSGGAGVEALSRGARSAVFVEKDTGAADCIRKNLEKTKLASRGRIFVEEAELALDRLAEENAQFDVIFMDPPYRKGYEEKTCEAIMKKGLLAEKGLMIVESALETEKVKQYRIAKFTLLRRNEGECK